VEKLFSDAKCFRDEDRGPTASREFTQIDIEASFRTPDDIFSLTERMLARSSRADAELDTRTPVDPDLSRKIGRDFDSRQPIVDRGLSFREFS